MRGYLIFLKKELLEYVRTYKLLILIMVFLALGFMNPVSAKYLPDLMAEFMPEGVVLNLPEPTILDSWAQFFKNVPQMGLIIFIIVNGGIMAAEFQKGTLIPVLTKGLPRHTILLSKLTVSVLVWSVGYALAFSTTYLYSLLFWKDAYVDGIIPAVLYVWLFGVLLLCLVILGSTITENYAGGLLFAGGGFVISMSLSIFHGPDRYSPIRLVSDNMNLLRQTAETADFVPAVAVTAVSAALFILLGVLVFRRKQV